MMSIEEIIRQWIMGSIGPSAAAIQGMAKLWLRHKDPNLSDWEIDEQAESRKLLDSILYILQKEYNKAITEGIPSFFTFPATNVDINSVVFRFDNKHWHYRYTEEVKNRIWCISEIMSAMSMLDACDSLSFEMFCVDLLNARGYDVILPQVRKREGGCDFYGYNYKCKDTMPIHVRKIPGNYDFGLQRGVRCRIFGQAKRWNSPIGEDAALGFEGKFRRFKAGRGRAIAIVSQSFKEDPATLCGLLCTNISLTRDARKILGDAGIFHREGIHLAWYAILSMDDWFDDGSKFRVAGFVDHYNASAKRFCGVNH